MKTGFRISICGVSSRHLGSGRRLRAISIAIAVAMFVVSFASVAASAEIFPDYNNIFIQVANDAGPKYDAFSNGTYNIRFEGIDRGLNALHISTDPGQNIGQVTLTRNMSGTFYATDSGGKGYDDEILLLVAVNGTIPDDFSLRITSDGYTWTPNPNRNQPPPLETVVYQPVALDENFTESDFIYGPQIWKPSGNGFGYPIYAGQDMTDTGNSFRLLFIDLNSGVLRPNAALQNQGAVRINYTLENFSTFAAFSVYGYCMNPNNGDDMVAWTNALLPTRDMSGYSVQYVPPLPVADFTANRTTGTAPVAVRFNDTSTNPALWFWDFGDGNTSLEQDPVHVYMIPGNYNVNLTVTNAAGSDYELKNGYISVEEPLGDRIAVYRDGSWYMDLNGDGSFTASDLSCRFGAAGWTPVVGDWNGNGTREIGVYLNGSWYLDMNGDGAFTGGDRFCSFGAAGWIPVIGDWDGDNTDEIGICRDGAWYLDVNGDGAFTGGDRYSAFGAAGWIPVIGDWDGDNADEIGIFRNGAWYLDVNGDGVFTGGDRYCSFGAAGWTPVVGDWDGDHTDEIGIYRDGSWYLDMNGDGAFTGGDRFSAFGAAGWTSVVGDWDGDSAGEIGIYLNGAWYLDKNGNGIWDTEDAFRGFGAAGWVPVIW